MAMNDDREQREYDKFGETPDGETGVRTLIGGLAGGVDYDEFDITWSDEEIDTIEFSKNSSVILTLTFTYTDGKITNVVRS